MRKIYFILCAVVMPCIVFAQVPNTGMEYWRNDTSVGSTPGMTTPHTPFPVQVPVSWYGSDSLIIALGESYGAAAFGSTDTNWHRQIFQESVKKHGGSYSAKIMTAYEDTFLIPGVISNAIPSVSFTIFPTPSITGIKLSGGTPVSVKPTSVSAYVIYYAGVDSSGYTGIDSGTLTVQALAYIDGVDSVIGTGSVNIGPDSNWEQVTANVVYTDNTDPVDTFRVAFASSKGQSGLDSSTLYVDDISMTSEPNPASHAGVANIATNGAVKIYPNPSTGMLYIDAALNEEMDCRLYSVSGQLVVTRALAPMHDMIDISSLPDGMYFYDIQCNGNTVQRGKVVLSR